MANKIRETIKGYNSYIENIEEKIKVKTVIFDDKYEMITRRKDIEDVKDL